MTAGDRQSACPVLAWLHIGDLHMAGAGERNHLDLQRIVALANGLSPGGIDFVFLPGDNADQGSAAQYALVRDAVAPLNAPLHVLPGDHDFEPGNLDAFHQVLGARRLPYAETLQGYRCLFLDVVSAGAGGPDFRLGPDQLAWAEGQVEAARAHGQTAVVFMHAYPADLRQGADRLGALLARPDVACVDMGHTHYNELANDGGTVFMATRSTGQAEEGPPGFSVAAVDGGAVSWRFKALDRAWPFVLVTSPADRRLVTDPRQAVCGPFAVRAKVLGDAPPAAAVEVSVDGGAWLPMAVSGQGASMWEAWVDAPGRVMRVRARDADGREDEDGVEPAGPGWTEGARARDGSDRDRIAAWPEKGILGTQLGPNRNGRKW